MLPAEISSFNPSASVPAPPVKNWPDPVAARPPIEPATSVPSVAVVVPKISLTAVPVRLVMDKLEMEPYLLDFNSNAPEPFIEALTVEEELEKLLAPFIADCTKLAKSVEV